MKVFRLAILASDDFNDKKIFNKIAKEYIDVSIIEEIVCLRNSEFSKTILTPFCAENDIKLKTATSNVIVEISDLMIVLKSNDNDYLIQIAKGKYKHIPVFTFDINNNNKKIKK